MVMTFFACSKEVAFLDNFFKLTKSHNEVATINYQEPTSVFIVPDFVVTGDVYKFSYVVTEGDGFLRHTNQNELEQNTQHNCEALGLEFEFIGTEIGVAVIVFSVTDYNGNREDILLVYNVVHNPFEWNANSETTTIPLNEPMPLNLVLNNVGVDQTVTYVSKITFLQGSGILEFTDDIGASTTEIEQGESYNIEDGEHVYNLTLDQIGVSII